MSSRPPVAASGEAAAAAPTCTPPAATMDCVCPANVPYSRLPATHWKEFASLVLEAAYEATIWSAVLNAQRGASDVVLLTSLSGSAFGNVSFGTGCRRRSARQVHDPIDIGGSTLRRLFTRSAISWPGEVRQGAFPAFAGPTIGLGASGDVVLYSLSSAPYKIAIRSWPAVDLPDV